MRDIWIVAENPAWAAVLAAAAKNIDQNAKTVAFVKGDEAAAKEAGSYGAFAAFALPQPEDGLWEDYAAPLAEKAKAGQPALILVSASKRGRDLAAQAAAMLDAPLFTDAKNIKVEGDVVTAETMIYGGAGVKTSSASVPVVLATIGAKDFEPAAAGGASAFVETLSCAAGQAKVTGHQPRAAASVNLPDAAKVVSVGRGFSEESELSFARDLAAALGAELACSRPIAEFFKWLPEECYVGISGQQLKPALYLAVGVSGQAQHLFGCRDAKCVVSVNKDAECPMNQNADYYIVGDFKEVIPAIMRAFCN